MYGLLGKYIKSSAPREFAACLLHHGLAHVQEGIPVDIASAVWEIQQHTQLLRATWPLFWGVLDTCSLVRLKWVPLRGFL